MVRIPAQCPDFSHRGTGEAQKVFSLFNPQGNHQLSRRHTGFFCKPPVKTGAAQPGFGNQPVNRNGLGEVFPDMTDGLTDDPGVSR